MTTPSVAPLSGGGDIASTLRRIEQRLARLEATLAPVEELVSNSEATIATVGDIFDEQARAIGNVDIRLRALGEILERLTRPKTLETLAGLVDIAEEAPNIAATLGDIADEVIAEAAKDGLDTTHLLGQAKKLVFGLLRVTVSPELDALLSSGMLDPKALKVLGYTARAVADAAEKESPQVGLFGAMGRLGDPDVKTAVGFLLQVAGSLGRTLKRNKNRLSA